MQKMDIFELYNKACADNNTQQSGHLRPNRNYNEWINTISIDLFNSYYKQVGKNQRIKDILDAAFLKSVNAPTVDQPGKDYDFIPYPADYGYYSSVRAFKNGETNCGCIVSGVDIFNPSTGACGKYEDADFKAIREKFKGSSVSETMARKVANDAWGAAINHKLKKPNWGNVILTEMEGGFKVVPKGLGIVLLDYYRYPVKALFAYTSPGGVITYDQPNSIQLDWPKQVEPEFLTALKLRFSSFTGQREKYQEGMVEKKDL